MRERERESNHFQEEEEEEKEVVFHLCELSVCFLLQFPAAAVDDFQSTKVVIPSFCSFLFLHAVLQNLFVGYFLLTETTHS